MSDRSSSGSIPWLKRFSARVTRSTLPVRSPCPKRQPSTRSMPASMASSAVAIPVPRSLWAESATNSRRERLRLTYSIWSAYTLGVQRSTVVGRLTTISRPGPGCQTSMTASHTSSAKSSSVSTKISGEYSNPATVSSPSVFSM